MATELGTGYVTLVPSAKGFASKAKAEIDADRIGTDLGTTVARRMNAAITGGLKDPVSSRFVADATQGGAKAGAAAGKAMAGGIEAKLGGVDVTKSVKATKGGGLLAALGFGKAAKAGTAAGEQAGANVAEGLDKSLTKGGGLFAGVGLASLFGPLAAGAGVAVASKQFFDAASNMNESMNKVQVVFGDASQSIIDFSSNAAKNLGLSKQAALEATGTFGNLFRAMGLGVGTSADMSTKLVGLAADLGSFNNVSTDDALVALKAGLVGETEPLRDLGVNLNEARIKAEALRLGLVKGNVNMVDVAAKTRAVEKAQAASNEAVKQYGKNSAQAVDAGIAVAKAQQDLEGALAGSNVELDAAQKAQAAYSLIMKDTTLAQGDFARTADGAANKQKTLTSEWEDFKAKAGAVLLPAGNTLLGWLITGLDNLSKWWDEHGETVVGGIKSIGDFFTNVFGTDPGANFANGVATIQDGLNGMFGEDKIGAFKSGAAAVSATVTAIFGEDPLQNFKNGITVIQDSLNGMFGEDKIANFNLGAGQVSATVTGIFGEDPLQNFKDGITVIQDSLNGLFGEDKIGAFKSGVGIVKDQIAEIGQVIHDVGNAFGWVWDQLTKLQDNEIWKRLTGPIGQGGDTLMQTLQTVAGLFHADDGGVVPGRRGSPQLIVAHGGETVLATHKPFFAMPPSMPGAGGGSSVPINATMNFYNVRESDTAWAARHELHKLSLLATNR